jgi:hypothetical protein
MMNKAEQIARRIINVLDEECEDLSKEDYLEVLEELHSEIGGRIDATEEEISDRHDD